MCDARETKRAWRIYAVPIHATPIDPILTNARKHPNEHSQDMIRNVLLAVSFALGMVFMAQTAKRGQTTQVGG